VAKKDSTGLLAHKPVDNKKWVPPPPHSRYIGWSGKEKGVYKARSKIGLCYGHAEQEWSNPEWSGITPE